MKTEIVSAQECAKAVALLREGEIVGLPTETVYGLAADALNPIAVAKIFEAKERPRFDPLIIHLPDLEWFERLIQVPTQDRQLVLKLAEAFWPGPFTLVLPRRSMVPDIVTAGLETAAVRISAHGTFSEVIRQFGGPLAAPSANRFGHVSPTTAQHVVDGLSGRVPLVVDAGRTELGLESTIVTVRDGHIEILRRGPVTEEEVATFGETAVSVPENITAPGQLPSHYAPRKPLRLVANPSSFAGERVGLLAWNKAEARDYAAIRQLSDRQDLREAAANLFRYLRELDAIDDVEVILAEPVPPTGVGAAIMDRLSRAANVTLHSAGR